MYEFENESKTSVASHVHDKQKTQAIANRLAKAIGHLQSIKRMVENDRECSEVLIQIAAVKSAINEAGKELLKNHINHCIVHAVQEGDTETIENLNKAIGRFM